jgi:sugar/nucleoside kinase (ribokinase family)
MTVLVVGSTAIDTVETPFGKQEAIGGSSTYFGLAASKFAEVRLVSVVGEDFPEDARALLADQGIRLEGLEVKPGKTFRWSGKYSADMNQRETIDVQLNTFGDFRPNVPEVYRDSSSSSSRTARRRRRLRCSTRCRTRCSRSSTR